MDSLLQSVLTGDVDVAAIINWTLSIEDLPPPPELQSILSASQENSDSPASFPITPAAFRNHILNFIRDQADAILTAAENAPPSSAPGTPRGGGLHDKRLLATSASTTPRGVSSGGGQAATIAAAVEKKRVELSKLQRVSHRLAAPGAVDDLNFPALGASSNGAAASRLQEGSTVQDGFDAPILGRAGSHTSPSKPALTVNIHPRVKAVQQTVQSSSGDLASSPLQRQQSTPTRRRIVPTQVEHVKVKEPFIQAETAAIEPTISTSTAKVVEANDNEFNNVKQLETKPAPPRKRITAISVLDPSSQVEVLQQQKQKQQGTEQQQKAPTQPVQTTPPTTPIASTTTTSETHLPSTVAAAERQQSGIINTGDFLPPPPSTGGGGGPIIGPSPWLPRHVVNSQPLTAPAVALARLHAGLLRSSSSVALAEELEVLLSLLAVDSNLVLPGGSSGIFSNINTSRMSLNEGLKLPLLNLANAQKDGGVPIEGKTTAITSSSDTQKNEQQQQRPTSGDPVAKQLALELAAVALNEDGQDSSVNDTTTSLPQQDKAVEVKKRHEKNDDDILLDIHSMVLVPTGIAARQYAALVLQHCGSLLRALGPTLLENLQALIGPAALPTPNEEESDKDDTSTAAVVAEGIDSFRKAVSDALSEARSRQLHTEKAYDSAIVRSGSGQLTGLQSQTSDGNKSRTSEEQRRISNRETTRDEWFALLREATSKSQSFHNPKPVSNLSLGGNNNNKGFTAQQTPEAVALGVLQSGTTGLLRRLRPDNYPAFAELFTSAVLQAAATGESFLDEELSKLAGKNVSKFHSLNQRMQGAPPSITAATRGGNKRIGGKQSHAYHAQQQQQPVIQLGFHTARHGNNIKPPTGSSSRLQSNSSIPNQNRPGSSGSNTQNRGDRSIAGLDESGVLAAEIAAEFPPALRIYVLFLEAADSHRLNVNLLKCMTGRLKSLTQSTASAENTSGMGQKTVATCTLAAFLGYLAFGRAATMGGGSSATTGFDDDKDDEEEDDGLGEKKCDGNKTDESPDSTTSRKSVLLDTTTSSATTSPVGKVRVDSKGRPDSAMMMIAEKKVTVPKFDGTHPIDVLHSLITASDAGSLPRTLPWVAKYIWFLKWDPSNARKSYFKCVLRSLAALRQAPEYSPAYPMFGPAALCTRAVLDELAEHLGEDWNRAAAKVLLASSSSRGVGSDTATHLTIHEHSSGGLYNTPLTSSSYNGLLSIKGVGSLDVLVDARYMQLFCPGLERSKRVLQLAATAFGERRQLLNAEGDRLRIPKKIRPAAPLPSTTIQRLSFQVPLSVSTAAAGIQDVVKLKLQRKFLDQYSTDEHKVKLKDIVDFVSDVVACNGASAAMKKHLNDALENAAQQLNKAAHDYVVSHNTTTASITSGEDTKQQPVVIARDLRLEATLRLKLLADAEKLIASTTTQILETSQKEASDEIRTNAVRSIVALTPSEFGSSVVGTAAAIVAEAGEVACARRLLSDVPVAVRNGVMRRMDGAISTALKEARSSARNVASTGSTK